MRRFATFALALLTVLSASLLPVCAGAFCCPAVAELTMEAAMPCCAETSVTPREDVRSLPATSPSAAPAPQTWTPMIAVALPRANAFVPVRIAHTEDSPPRHEPSPPLFLLNAQFLI
ncbi:MAG TPA: hypothetical protein VGD79_07720 [Thermoanaerobaculia bacterium]|jgi:hypothetical protein